MANQRQLALLRQGVIAWNAWREQHPYTSPDLRGADLRTTALSKANLRGADFRGADFRGADLNEANLRGTTLRGADLSEADLSKVDLRGVSLSKADLSGTTLKGANLSEANLSEANLSGANLSGADLSGADLSGADLSGADLSGAALIGTTLIGTTLIGADLSRASVGKTTFGAADLSTVKGLETVDHLAPSTIGADTLLRSEGHIPETFLRQAGLTDTFITYIRSLTQNPIEYYTCFISYSSKDQAFTERLYADLQSKGVRCWYAPEDLKIGDEFRKRIDETIRLYDKLLVVLSHHSIQSGWVKTEVEAAFEKEQRQKKLVLFPIKLDETIMETNEAWAADIRRRRHIGDFLKWKEHDAYQAAFQRLLRDLQASSIPPTSKP